MNAGTERDGVVQIGDDDDPEMGCRIPAVASGPASITRLRHLLHRSAASERVLLRRQRRLRRRRVTMKTISAALHADGKMKRFFFFSSYFSLNPMRIRWIIKDEESENYLMTELKPYTQYALYVQTYTVAPHSAGDRIGARSPIIYARTDPAGTTSTIYLLFTWLLYHHLPIIYLVTLPPSTNYNTWLETKSCRIS